MTSSQQHVTSKPPPRKPNRTISIIAMILVAGIVSPFLMSTMMTAEGGGAAAEEALEGGAAAEEKKERASSMFTISGKETPELFFRRFVQRLGLENKVRLPAGRIHPDDIHDFFQTILTNICSGGDRIRFMNTWMQTAADLKMNVGVDRSQLSVCESIVELPADLRKETLQLRGYSMYDELRPPPPLRERLLLADDDELTGPYEPHAEWKRIISEEDKYMCCVGKNTYEVALQRLQRKTYERYGILHILHRFHINLMNDQSDEVKALLLSPNEIRPEEILANQESLLKLYEFIDALNSPYVRSQVLSYLEEAASTKLSESTTSLGGGAASPLQSNASSNASTPLGASPLPLSKFARTGCSVM